MANFFGKDPTWPQKFRSKYGSCPPLNHYVPRLLTTGTLINIIPYITSINLPNKNAESILFMISLVLPHLRRLFYFSQLTAACRTPRTHVCKKKIKKIIEYKAYVENHRVHILVEMKQGQCICPLSWSGHCNFTGEGKCSERGWPCTPPPSPARAYFPLITACTPESSGCNSVCTLCWKHSRKVQIGSANDDEEDDIKKLTSLSLRINVYAPESQNWLKLAIHRSEYSNACNFCTGKTKWLWKAQV